MVTKLQADLRQAQDAGAAAARQLDVASQENSQLHAQLQQSRTHRQDQMSSVVCMTADDSGMSQHVCLTTRLILTMAVYATGVR